jgi:leucyl/phenylalanyl-tRNA--protein transferase
MSIQTQEDLVNALLDAYGQGVFPMSDARDAVDTYWVDPPMLGVIPLDEFHIPSSLQKFSKKCDYSVTFDTAFKDVIKACAQTPRGDGQGTWINHDIEFWFNTLHHAGHAHSVEIWDKNNVLIGGIYGLAQGACFNGESMFSTKTNASKIALAALVDRLNDKGFTLFDTQFTNDHIKQFGCIEIPKGEYMRRLADALDKTHVSFT